MIDPAWAVPANTVLLGVFAAVQWYAVRRAGRTEKEVRTTKRIVKESHNELADVLNGVQKPDGSSVRKFRMAEDRPDTETLRPENHPRE